MKLLASLLASAALGLSMLVAVPSAASAAPPYPGTVATTCGYVVPKTVRKNRKLFVNYRVRASGNAHPRGVVKFRVYKILRSGKPKIFRTLSKSYVGPNWRTTSLGTFKKKGRYSTRIWFRPAQGSVFKASKSGIRYFRVKRR